MMMRVAHFTPVHQDYTFTGVRRAFVLLPFADLKQWERVECLNHKPSPALRLATPVPARQSFSTLSCIGVRDRIINTINQLEWMNVTRALYDIP